MSWFRESIVMAWITGCHQNLTVCCKLLRFVFRILLYIVAEIMQ